MGCPEIHRLTTFFSLFFHGNKKGGTPHFQTTPNQHLLHLPTSRSAPSGFKLKPKRSVVSLSAAWFMEKSNTKNIQNDSNTIISTYINYGWLVVWNMNFRIGKNHPNWLSYFSEGLKPPTRWINNMIQYEHVWTIRLDKQGEQRIITRSLLKASEK